MSTQTGYPRATLWRGIPTQELSNQPTTQLWPVLQRFHVEQTQTTWNGESFLPFHWTSCTCQELDHWGYLTICKTHSSRQICDWYRINSHFKYPTETRVLVDDLSEKKPYRACSVSRQAWGLTEANVLVWPCPALLVLHTFRRVRTALRYLDYQKTPSAAQKKTLGLSVLCDLRSASPLRILLPAPLVCVFMSILTCIWCIGTSRKHPV